MSPRTAKERTRDLRLSCVIAAIVTIMFYAMTRYLIGSSLPVDYLSRHMPIFGDVMQMPDFFRDSTVLNVAMMFGCTWLCFYSLVNVHDDGPGTRPLIGTALRLCAFGGGAWGLMITSLAGWFRGLEAFIVVIVLVVGLIVSLTVLVGLLFGIGTGLAIGCGLLWEHLEPTWFGRQINRIGSFFNADDIPDHPEPTNLTT